MKKYPESPIEARDRLLKIAKILWWDADRLVALKCFMETGDPPEVAKPIVSAGHGELAFILKASVVDAIVLRCARSCDSADPDKYSIPTAKVLLENRATFETVAAQGDRDALNNFVRFADEIVVTHAHERLRDFRNFHLAHHLPDKLEAVEKANFKHLREVVDDVVATIVHLTHGTGIRRLSSEGVAQVWTPRCSAFWRKLMQN